MALVRSIASFQDKVRVHLSNGNLNAALSSIEKLVNQVFCEPINTAQTFGSKGLDDICQEVGAINWKKLHNIDALWTDKQLDQSENTVVYIVSKLQASGGHSAVLADIIRLSPPSNTFILITGVGGKTDREAIQHRFKSLHNVSFEYAPRGKHIEKLDWLQRKILSLKPKDVWLFNHHQDSVAIAAVQPNATYKLHFYHHGDHNLCLGVHLDYADHVDIHPMGYHYCRDELNIINSRYLPMSLKDLGMRPSDMEFKSGSDFITCTAAGFNKVEVPYFIQYVDIIPSMLKASGGKHIHFGRLTPFALSKIRAGLRKLGIPESSFIYIPFVSSVWKALHEHQVDMYITSFPYGGARTLIEVMGAGLPVAIHSHCTSRLLGTFDMVYEGAFVWRNPNELYDFIHKIDISILKKHSKLARNRYLGFHTEDIIAKALLENASPLAAPPLNDGYTPDNLQRALDITNQVSCLGAIRRLLYRNFREWKSSRS